MTQEMLRAEVRMAEREVVEAKDAWAQAYEKNPGDSIRLAQITQRIGMAEDALAALWRKLDNSQPFSSSGNSRRARQ